MYKKLTFLALILAFLWCSAAQAATIIWVSDNKTPANGVPADQAWVDLLVANGYTVDLSFRNQEARTLDQAKIDALNAADLIIISRDTDSGNYDDADEINQWNSLTSPLLLQVIHLTRSNRWKWLDTTNTDTGQPAMEVVDTGHPVFSGITLGAGNQVAVVEGGDCSLGNVTNPGNGTVLAKRADNGGIWIEEWDAGVEYYPGSGQFAGSHRMYFGGGGTVNASDGAFNFTADGGTMFINAVRYMLGEAKREKASGPSPEDGAYIQDTWATLSWTPGDLAVSHDVYVGENRDEVNDGTGDTFRGNQAATFATVGFPGFPYPDGLVPGTTYYWRIDEVNPAEPNSPWKGDVWSFKVPPRTAYNPIPADGAEFVAPGITLSWTGGYGSKLHTVYFGNSYDDVNNASGGLPQGAATYRPAAPLETEKVYYWRVDEFDALATHKGSVWGFTTPDAAGSLKPANGAKSVPLDSKLTWTPAATAVSHDVYFGTDKDAVRNATKASPEYKGNKAAGSETYDPGMLVWNSDYYWRVDAVYSADTVKGLVWSFTSADFLLVDDFESYNDIDPPDAASNRIFDNWVDGFGTTTNGALVGNDLPPYAEQTNVHGGSQAMVYRYDNNLKTSEATQTLASRDWTAEGVTKLSLWFRGAKANSAERMYVALNGNAVAYNDDVAATQSGVWTQWVIDLQVFAGQGVNLASVNTITLGVGTKNSPAAGGTGTLYFDDIRLTR